MIKKIALSSVLTLAVACHEIPQDQQPPHRASDDVAGLAVMTQMMMMAGAPGLIFFPFLVAADIHATNAAMEESRSKATLAQTYEYAYDRSFNTVASSGNTGDIFRDMKSATAHFRSVLLGHGVANANAYVLTAVRSADQEGFTLYSAAIRPVRSVQVRTVSGRLRTLTEADKDFYRPIQYDALGIQVDRVVDWAGVERRMIATQKGQAILMTLAANSVLIGRRSEDYWQARHRWLTGDYRGVVAERRQEIDRRLGQL